MREYYLDLIERECVAGAAARQSGNEGRCRVCARRAAGYAAAWLYRSRGTQVKDTDSLMLLRRAASDSSIPVQVREASSRLAARVSANFTYAFPTDPLDDARIIVDYVKSVLA